MVSHFKRRVFVLFFFLLAVACTNSKTKAPSQEISLVEQGRDVYMAYCISCHSTDPSEEGPLGPPVKGSSQELLEARIIHNTYPTGYRPKRDTKVMAPLPYLKRDLEALTVFLNR